MPLTKVRYDMLDAEVTTRITQSINSSGAGSPFVFTADGSKETLTQFKVDGVNKDIRNTAINGQGLLEITLASFTPTISSSGAPSASLSWDQAATGFSVSVTNPDDYTSAYIDAVAGIAALNGSSITETLANYTAGARSATPAGGVDWTQTFTTGGSSYIRSNGSLGSGGSASGRVSFTYNDGTSKPFTDATADFTINWASVSHNISIAGVSGKTFLKTYTSSNYTVSTSGLSDTSNVVHTVTGTNGTPSSPTGSGTLNFTVPINKDNAGTARKVTLASAFTRPQAVTGTSYTHNPTNDEATVTADFTYPSFTTWTADKDTAPSAANLIDDSTQNGFVSNTAIIPHMLGDEAGALSYQAITNTGGSRIFWFCVRGTHTNKPTVTTGNETLPIAAEPGNIFEQTFTLQPSTTPTGWTSPVTYRAWGVLLNNGTTYVSFSGA